MTTILSSVRLARTASASVGNPCNSYTAVLADAQPAALLAVVSFAVVLADARPAALLAPASSAVVLADA